MGAGFQRREQGWEHQRKLAEHDLKVIEKELAMAIQKEFKIPARPLSEARQYVLAQYK